MSQKHVHNLIILDESGSMNSIKQPTISGFNELAQTIIGTEETEPNLKQKVTFVTFNGLATKTLLGNADPKELAELDTDRYRPNASTPLYDAMGFAMNLTRSFITDLPDVTVLVTIFTDGMENASKEYSLASVKALVEELSTKGWTFTYIGANHDVHAAARDLSINNVLAYQADAAGVKKAMRKDRKSRKKYYASRMSANFDTSAPMANYFDEGEDSKS